jgi:acyl dehydratase
MTRAVVVEDIVRFTEMSGDRDPVHYDAEAAARPCVVRGDGEVLIDGTAVCWTFDVAPPKA